MRAGVRELAVFTLVAALSVSACGKKKPAATPLPPQPAAEAPRTTPPPPPPPPPPPRETTQPRVPTEDEVFAGKSLDDLNRERPLGDVLFAYDLAELSDASRAVLQKNADWLRRWSATRVTIEGHADSRGTNEYNLALGERRASTVRDYLSSLGISNARMSIISKGEEDPICKDENESCWAQNRRSHFVITAK